MEVQRQLVVITVDSEQHSGQRQEQRARPSDATLRVQTSQTAWSRTSRTTVRTWTLLGHPSPHPLRRRRLTSPSCLPSTSVRNATPSDARSAFPLRSPATTVPTACSTSPPPMCAPTRTGELWQSLCQADDARCARSCFACPQCCVALSVLPSMKQDERGHHVGGAPYFFLCPSCKWSSHEIGWLFEKPSSLASELQLRRWGDS